MTDLPVPYVREIILASKQIDAFTTKAFTTPKE
jgi:hypothetical protein